MEGLAYGARICCDINSDNGNNIINIPRKKNFNNEDEYKAFIYYNSNIKATNNNEIEKINNKSNKKERKKYIEAFRYIKKYPELGTWVEDFEIDEKKLKIIKKVSFINISLFFKRVEYI